MTDHELAKIADEIFGHFDRREAAPERTRRLREWALSVFCWDGLLPVAVLSIPKILHVVFPNWKIGLAIVAVFGPVLALSIRFVFGWQRMRRGQAYIWQLIVFTVAISALFLFEAFILNDELGGGPKIADPTVVSVMFLVYLAMMAIALFPARVDQIGEMTARTLGAEDGPAR
jgi:hypothetical protein